jgi:hypothetical protein
MKTLVLLLALAPMLALAQGGPGPGPGPGGPGMTPERQQRMQKRMQLALTLGLAEALDLTDAQALKIRGELEKLTPRRTAAHQQLRDAVQVLRRSAQGEKVAAADVDQAVTRLLDARAQIQAVDRELVTTVTRDQPPEKRARAVLFLAKFHQRVMRGPGGGMGRGPGRGVMGPGGPGVGPGGPGVGPGGGAGAGPIGMADDAGWDDLDDER